MGTPVTSTSVALGTAQTAVKLAPINIPLFDPVYSVLNVRANTFAPSSPNPYLFHDWRALSSGAIVYEKSQLLTPFSVGTLTWGNPAVGAATGEVKAGWNANKDVMTGPGFGAAGSRVFHPNNTFPLAGGNIASGASGSNTDVTLYGSTPVFQSAREVFYIWSNDAPPLFSFDHFNYVLDLLALDKLGNECDIFLPFPIVSGAPFFPEFGLLQNFNCFRSILTGHMEQVINAFSNVPGNNLYFVSNDAVITGQGTTVAIMSIDVDSASPIQIFPLKFDDANIQTLVNAGNCEIQGTNFGWVITWAKGTYELIKGQGVQSILLTITKDILNNQVIEPRYAPLLMLPQTTKSGSAVGDANIANVKIDPNGILYVRSGNDPTYVANSKGLDITIAGVGPFVDMSKALGNLSLPSFCPCSPVAVKSSGA